MKNTTNITLSDVLNQSSVTYEAKVTLLNGLVMEFFDADENPVGWLVVENHGGEVKMHTFAPDTGEGEEEGVTTSGFADYSGTAEFKVIFPVLNARIKQRRKLTSFVVI